MASWKLTRNVKIETETQVKYLRFIKRNALLLISSFHKRGEEQIEKQTLKFLVSTIPAIRDPGLFVKKKKPFKRKYVE